MGYGEIKTAYQPLGKGAVLHDGMITCSTLPGGLICGLARKMNKPRNDHYLNLVLSSIPEDFSGRILEVPVGTGTLTMLVYRMLPETDITCLDYSTAVVGTVQRRATVAEFSNVHFTQDDVGSLPLSDNTFDLALSLNGFHVFPSKEAAHRRTFRVLELGGIFCDYFYIQGKQSRADWFIGELYVPKSFFTPSFETAASLENRMK